jgi:hypothetical protein
MSDKETLKEVLLNFGFRRATSYENFQPYKIEHVLRIGYYGYSLLVYTNPDEKMRPMWYLETHTGIDLRERLIYHMACL